MGHRREKHGQIKCMLDNQSSITQNKFSKFYLLYWGHGPF